jgi:hypothetical protein
MSKFNLLFRSTERLIVDNSTTILTCVGVLGTISTAVLGIRGGMEAKEKLIAESDRRHQENGTSTPYTFTNTEKAKLVWLDFAPAVGTAGLTIAAIVCSHRISAGRIAAVTAAYSLSESKLKDYKRAIEEKLGIEKKEEVDEHFNKQRAENAPTVERSPQRPIIISGDQQLFFDIYSGRYFEASMEDLRSAENDMNYKVIQDNQCPLSHFYETIGLPGIALGDDWGWDSTCPAEFKYSPNIDDNTGKACIWVEYDVEPLRGWNHLER